MGGAHNERRRKNPAVYEFLQYQRPERLAGLPGLVAGQVSQVTIPSPDLEIRAEPMIGNNLLDPAAQLAADLVKAFSDPLLLAAVDDGQHGRQRPGLSSGGLRQQEDPVGIVGEAAETHKDRKSVV